MDTGESGARFLSDGKILGGESMNRLPNNCCARLLGLLTAFSAGRPLAQSERDTLAATPPIGSEQFRQVCKRHRGITWPPNARSLPGFAPDSRSWALGLFWLDSVFSSVSSISCVQVSRQPPSLPRFGLGLPCFS